jgi:glycine cleavage system H protein
VNALELPFPADLHYLVEHDVWARLEGDGSATVGITALGIKLSGEIYMCRAKPVGSLIGQGRSVAVVELAKAIVSVKSAVTGEVLEVNPLLEERPELVHRDPYGAGWLARLALRDLEGDRRHLAQGADVIDVMTRHALAMARTP